MYTYVTRGQGGPEGLGGRGFSVSSAGAGAAAILRVERRLRRAWGGAHVAGSRALRLSSAAVRALMASRAPEPRAGVPRVSRGCR